MLLLPLVSFYALFRVTRLCTSGLRERLLIAGIWWALCLIAITELLSVLTAVHRVPMAAAWTVIAALTFCTDFVISRRREPSVLRNGPDTPRAVLLPDRFLFGGCIAVIALTLLTAVIAPPNGWDVTLQHLPRVMEWMAQGSVRLFPTNYYVEDFAPPLSEWTMMHLFLLQGSDRFVNLVQWASSAATAVAVSMVAKELGCTIRGQLIAALLCLTIPQGVLSASGAKNDWMVALWLCSAVWLMLRWQRDPRRIYAITLGIALGELVLAKGTGAVYGAPVMLALLLVTPRPNRARVPALCLLAGAILMLMNTPQWSQDYRLNHSIFGLSAPDAGGRLKYTADRVTPTTIAANIVREITLHAGSPLASVNRRTAGVARRLIRALQVQPDDPALVRPGPAYAVPPYSLDEYFAGNPLHLLLALAAFGFVLFHLRAMPREAALAFGISAAFVVYCALFKWEIWAGRLHLALFAAACPVIAAAFSRQYPRAMLAAVALAFLLAMPPLLFNSTRPLISSNPLRALLHRPADPEGRSILFRGRDEMYFGESTDLPDTYLPAAETARTIPCKHVGIDDANHPVSYTYILMGIIDNGSPVHTYRYVGVSNLTSRFQSGIDRQPACMVLCVRCLHDREKMLRYSADLPKVQSFGTLVLFSRPARR